MDLGLNGRLVVITGASAGIGRATALELAREGASLVLGARDAGRLEDTAAEARAAGAGTVESVAADLTDPDGVAALTRAAEALGDVHGLVTCVGSTPLGTFDEIDDDVWRQAFDMKFLATVRAVRTVLPLMARQSSARIVMVGGNAALSPDPWMATSGAMNAALGNLASTLGQSLGDQGVGVVCVHPGPTRSARLDGLVDTLARRLDVGPEEAESWLTARVPRGLLAETEDVAATVAFLCSPRAAHLTGTTVSVDGAQSWAR